MSTVFTKGEKLEATKLNQAFSEKSDVEHKHTVEDITDFEDAISVKADVQHSHEMEDINGLDGALDQKANAEHTHQIADVTGLSSALAGKANTTHGHSIQQVTGLDAALSDLASGIAGKANATHSHTVASLPIASEQQAEAGTSNTVLMTPARVRSFVNANALPEIIGQPFGGGYYAGRVWLPSGAYLIILAPRAQGQTNSAQWATTVGSASIVNNSTDYLDSVGNTNAQVGSVFSLANWARGLNIGGLQDWVIPAYQVMRQIYKNFADVVASDPFISQEIFTSAYYWTSTQYANHSPYVWGVHMGNGSVTQLYKTSGYPARAVRLIKI